MKKLILSLIVMLVSLSSFANEIYFSKERMNRFACKVAQSIKVAYPDKTLKDFRGEILDLLRTDINPWVDAYPIPAGISLPRYVEKLTGFPGFPMDRSEYYLQNAFILFGNPKLELKEPVDNYFSSFIHLARKRHIDYLNGKTKKFSLRNEENLRQQIEEHLPFVANFTFPFLDLDGLPITQTKKPGSKGKPFTLAIGNPDHKMFSEFTVESQKYNQFSSPLFVWLLDQKNFSVTPEKLFSKALEIYGDPIVALGVIPWIMSGDALTVDRQTSSVVSYKLERLVEGDDVPGLHYHFWGYLTQGFIGNKLRVGTLAFIYEKLYQKDIQDWTIDALSLKTSQQIRDSFRHPERCL
ncbi:MAG: hypothetical protein H7177_11475 [Rhizobacter sp.]|nr:hypothetical protein [Bacteriovorax sp.]